MTVAPVANGDGDVSELVLRHGGPLDRQRRAEVADGPEVLDLGPCAEGPVDDRMIGHQRRHRADVAAARGHGRPERGRQLVGVVGVLGHDRHAAIVDPVQQRIEFSDAPVAVVDPAVVHDVDVGQVGRGEVRGEGLQRDRVVQRHRAGRSEVGRILHISARRSPVEQVVAVAARDRDIGQRGRSRRDSGRCQHQHRRDDGHHHGDASA